MIIQEPQPQIFCYKDRTPTIGSFAQHSKIVSTFKADAKAGGNPTINTKKNDEFNLV